MLFLPGITDCRKVIGQRESFRLALRRKRPFSTDLSGGAHGIAPAKRFASAVRAEGSVGVASALGLHPISWWWKHGASHRKKGGHVTPKLGTAERLHSAQSLRKLTSAASTHLVARGMSVVSNADVCGGENGSERRSSKRVEP